jgi:tetratricopeptide (TPR) repeat protein
MRLHRTRIVPLFAILLGLTLGHPAWACLNHYGKMNVHGETIPVDERRDSHMTYISRLNYHPEHDAIVNGPEPVEPAPDAHFKVRSDYAVALVHRGKTRKAVAIFEAIEKEHPGEYIVAANLGTAYELSGNLEKAHHWIGEGIRRNPKSHEASEWLHLKILEARQALEKDRDWVKTHGVLDLDFGSEARPVKPTNWPKESDGAEGVIQALSYQLSERLAFVPPPDALVAGMIADLADLLAIYRSVDHAIPVYELALEYQPVRADLIRKRLSASMDMRREELRREQAGRNSGFWGRVLISVAVAALGIAAIAWIRKGTAGA